MSASRSGQRCETAAFHICLLVNETLSCSLVSLIPLLGMHIACSQEGIIMNLSGMAQPVHLQYQVI